MKVKLNIDKNTIKNFSVDHAEKVIFGFVLLGVVMIIYSAVTGREKTDKKPADLSAKVAAANTAIEQAQIPEKKTAEIDKIAEMSRVKLEEEPFQLTNAICPPPGKQEHTRGEPPVLGVEKLRVAAGSGMFQIMAAPKAGERAGAQAASNAGVDQRGERWAVITGLVPVKKQCEAYADTFCDCKHLDPAKDAMPDYAGYWVERLEIASPADAKNPNWKNAKKVVKFNSNTVRNNVMKDWGTSMQLDPTDPRYLNPSLSFPVGPWTDGVWDASIAHEPEVPLAATAMAAMAAPPPETAPDQKPGEPENPTEPDKKPAEQEGFDDHTAAPGSGVPLVPGGGMYGGPRGYPAPGRPAPGMTTGAMADSNSIDFYLFRFFDFTVEPGKRYIYRVQLVVNNPNYDVKTVYLEKPEFAKKKYLVDEKWSEPSPVVSIPNDTSTLAIGVEQPRRLIGDPLGSMLVALWRQDTGLKVYNEFAVERGQLLNFPDADVKAAQSKVGGPMLTGAPDKTSLLSDVLVVDMAGGHKLPTLKPPTTSDATDQYNRHLPAKGTSPGEILVLEPNGTLVVRSEFDDMASVDSFTKVPVIPTGRPGMPPGMHGMPGYGPPGYGPPGYGSPGYGPPGYGPPGYGPPGVGIPSPAGGGYGNLFPRANGQPAPKKN